MLEILLKEIKRQELLEMKEEALPIVSLELFFNGNNDEGSIGCNLINHPGIEGFYNTLKEIRDKETVYDVFVEIYEVEEYWPFSERIYVLSTSSDEEVFTWLKELEPSDISIGYQFGEPKSAPKISDEVKVYSIWWD